MKARPLPSLELLNIMFDINPQTGIFVRKNAHQNKIRAYQVGSVAGYKSIDGYIYIGVQGKTYRAHRLAYLMYHGFCREDMEIDHINGDRSDNRASNLRMATRKQNGENKAVYKNNSSGYKGVFWHAQAKKWVAQIYHNKSRKYLGVYETAELAHNAYLTASKQLFTHSDRKNTR